MRRFLSAALEMLALWIRPAERPTREFKLPWSVVWSEAGPEAASRCVGEGRDYQEGVNVIMALAPDVVATYGGSCWLISPEGEVCGRYLAPKPEKRPPWLERIGTVWPN